MHRKYISNTFYFRNIIMGMFTYAYGIHTEERWKVFASFTSISFCVSNFSK